MNGFEYTFGIEEEYFLSTPAGGLAAHVPPRLLTNARAQLGDFVTSELLQSQIEIASPVFSDAEQAATTMPRMRRDLSQLVAEMDLRLLAASTHPLGAWRSQLATAKPRYDQLMSDFRIIGQRNLVCGMHVHVAIPPKVDRVMLMNRLMPWLPLFLALSTSSPFWDRRVTGLLSYRQAIYDEWPRSGIPDFFADERDYDSFTVLMQNAGAVPDASFFWWAIRPSAKFPTLELRIADVCTRAEDGVALAVLFRCLVATLAEQPMLGARRTTHTRRIIDENRWRAKRDGIAAKFIDEFSGSAIAVRDLLSKALDLVDGKARQLGCASALLGVRQIAERGTSAHAQLREYNERRAAGATQTVALHHVVDWLLDTTVAVQDDLPVTA